MDPNKKGCTAIAFEYDTSSSVCDEWEQGHFKIEIVTDSSQSEDFEIIDYYKEYEGSSHKWFFFASNNSDIGYETSEQITGITLRYSEFAYHENPKLCLTDVRLILAEFRL